MISFGKRFLQAFDDILKFNNWLDFNETTHDYHIENFDIFHFYSLFGCIYPEDVNVLSFRMPGNAIDVINQHTSRLDETLELVERLLVKNNCGVEIPHYGGAYSFIADNNSHICSAASHLRAIGWHPAYLHTLHHTRVCKDFAHR